MNDTLLMGQMQSIRLVRHAAMVASLAQGQGPRAHERSRGKSLGDSVPRPEPNGSSKGRSINTATLRAILFESFGAALQAEGPASYRLVHPDPAWMGLLDRNGAPTEKNSSVRTAWARTFKPTVKDRPFWWHPHKRPDPTPESVDLVITPTCGFRALRSGADSGAVVAIAGGMHGAFDSDALLGVDPLMDRFLVVVVGPTLAERFRESVQAWPKELGHSSAASFSPLWKTIESLREELKHCTEQSAIVNDLVYHDVLARVGLDWRTRVVPGGALATGLATLHGRGGAHIGLVKARVTSVALLATAVRCMGGAMIAIPLRVEFRMKASDAPLAAGATYLTETSVLKASKDDEALAGVFLVVSAVTDVPGFLEGVRFPIHHAAGSALVANLETQTLVTNSWDGTQSIATCVHDISRQHLWSKRGREKPRLRPAHDVLANIHSKIRPTPSRKDPS